MIRVVPRTSLHLEWTNDDGSKDALDLRLCWDFNVAARIEEKAGVNVLNLGFLQNLGPSLTSIILWACILREHPEYDSDEGLEAVRSWMQESNADAIFEAWWACYLANLPAAKRELLQKMRKEEEAKRARGDRPEEAAATSPLPPSQDPAGSNSGPLPATTSDSATTNSAP